MGIPFDIKEMFLEKVVAFLLGTFLFSVLFKLFIDAEPPFNVLTVATTLKRHSNVDEPDFFCLSSKLRYKSNFIDWKCFYTKYMGFLNKMNCLNHVPIYPSYHFSLICQTPFVVPLLRLAPKRLQCSMLNPGNEIGPRKALNQVIG